MLQVRPKDTLQRQVPLCKLILFLVRHQFGGYFVPATYHTKFTGYTSRHKTLQGCKIMTLCICITVMKHVPATESKVEPIRDNDQNSLCSYTGKNKIKISSGAHVAARLEWFGLKEKTACYFDDDDWWFCFLDDAFFSFLFVSIVFKVLVPYNWIILEMNNQCTGLAIISRNTKSCNYYMTVVLRNFSWRIIVNRFYSYGRHNFTSRIQYLKACWTLCCSTSLGNVPATFYCACICCDFDPATCLHYTSLLHIISACTTHVFVAATCLCNMIPCVWPPLDFCERKKNLYSPCTF